MLWFGTFCDFEMTDKGLKSIAKLKDLTHLRLNNFDLDITAKGLKYLIDSCERLKFVNIFDFHIHHSCLRCERRKLMKIKKHYEKYRKREETKCFWILWNRMKRWIQKTDTKQRSHCIQFDLMI